MQHVVQEISPLRCFPASEQTFGNLPQDLLRVEVLTWDNGTSPHREAQKVGEHHAKTMIKRHRDAEPIFFGQAHDRCREISVIQDVVMGQHHAA